MPDDLINLTTTTVLNYKARNGELKELRVVQPMDPSQQKMNYKDLQILAKEIAKVLKEDG
jgi:hypothetical protein